MPDFAKGMKKIQERQQQNQLASGLFQNVGIAESDSYGIQMIDYEKLYISPLNTYSVDPDVLDELSSQIEDIGLEQPLIVCPNNDRFEILGGQRRFLAIAIIRNKDKGKFAKVPCKVEDLTKVPDNIKGLPDDIKKIYITASTNNNRTMTDADYRLMVSQLNKVYEALQKSGITVGEKRRSFIAKQAGLGERTVQKILSAEKNLEPELKEQLAEKEPNISINLAEELSRLPEEQQLNIAERLEEGEQVSFESELSILVEEESQENIESSDEQEETISNEKIPMSQEEVASLLRVGEFSDLIVLIPRQFELSEKDRKKVENIGEKIQKLQGQVRKIMKGIIVE